VVCLWLAAGTLILSLSYIHAEMMSQSDAYRERWIRDSVAIWPKVVRYQDSAAFYGNATTNLVRTLSLSERGRESATSNPLLMFYSDRARLAKQLGTATRASLEVSVAEA
jgi:hypothetical protein